MDSLINWLKDAEKYEVRGQPVYAGPSPFTFDKGNPDDMARLMQRPWVISHPDAAGKLWKVTGLESFAIQTIREGSSIGLMVEEWA